ncbi:MAG: threonine synthase [Chloroflexi bacterium]|nr:threonine synthase [Chloroflexota bacterium]
MPEKICLIDRYADRLPVGAGTPRLTLGEGDTPLVRAPFLESETGIPEVWLKVEGANPTGSFKDRGMVVAVAKALEAGATSILCASTGNTAASAAAYAARARLRCAVVFPAGYVALGKLSQAIVFGAQVVAVRGGFDDALRLARDAAQREGATLVNSVNPLRLQGQKTAAFEVCEALGDAPDALFIPVGNAGNISAYWLGFVEAARSGLATKHPRMFGFQASGAAPIVRGAIVEHPETIATAIRIGNPASWDLAVKARDESGGAIEAVTDEDILDAYSTLARCEGIFCEPASAAAVAGLRLRARAGGTQGLRTVVCVLTGNGLKDPDRAMALAGGLIEVDADLDAVCAAIGRPL